MQFDKWENLPSVIWRKPFATQQRNKTNNNEIFVTKQIWSKMKQSNVKLSQINYLKVKGEKMSDVFHFK